ncbi:hypothetical protein CR513_14162, partial [Mucuna pruriens]
MQWMTTLPPRSIQTFRDLVSSFVSQFAANKAKNYLACFNNATVKVDDPDQKFFVKAFQKGLRAGPFSDALALRKPINMEEIRARAEKHVEMEEDQCEWRRLERRSDRKEMRHPDCWALRMQIEKLVQIGHLNRYVRQTSPKPHRVQDRSVQRMVGTDTGARSRSRQRTPTHRGTIATISGGGVVDFHAYTSKRMRGIGEKRVERIQAILTGANVTPLGRREPMPTISFDDRDMKSRIPG